MNQRKKTSKAKQAKRVPIVRLENIPRFRSEAEEAAWWDAHPEVITKAFERAFGKKAVEQVLRERPRPKRPPTKTVTIRLPVADVARARRLASRKGLGYQTLVKMLLHEALLGEERSQPRRPLRGLGTGSTPPSRRGWDIDRESIRESGALRLPNSALSALPRK